MQADVEITGGQLAVQKPNLAGPPAVLQATPTGMLQQPEPLFKTARQDVREMVDTIVARRVGDPSRDQENVD
jgi:hypothetical protein